MRKSPPKILIVDDEESLCNSLEAIFSSAGFPCRSAQTPSAALDIIARDCFDIGLLDINLPEMDGISLAKAIKKRAPSMGIILVSGYGTFDNAVKAIKIGVYDFIKKPFKTEEILLSVKRLAKLLNLERDLAVKTEELRKSEERYRTLVENIADGIALIYKGRIIFHTKAFSDMLGYDFPAITRFKLTDLGWEENALAEAFKAKTFKSSGQYRLRKKDGSSLWASVNASRITYKGKNTVIASFRDITAIVEAENMRRDMERMLRHDMRSQLVGIVGLVNRLLERTSLNPTQNEYCRLIRKCGMDLEEMIQNYLDAAKLEQASFTLRREHFNLLETVKHARDTLRELADKKNINIVIIFSHKVYSIDDHLVYFGDRLYLQNALNNLLKNAVEASPKDTTIKIKTKKKEESIEVSIHNWSAVPEEIHSTFFDKYVSAGKREGTGLGTYMARLVAEQHGGTISFNSSKNEGTTVVMELPVA